MKKSLKLFGVITLVAVMVITTVSCSKSGGGKILNSVEDLKAYLDSQPANSPEKPIKIAMRLNESMFPEVRKAINDAGKYVSLDLSGSPITTIPEGAFYDAEKKEGCKLLVGIIIPKDVTSIGGSAFKESGLTSITIPDIVGNEAFNGCTSLTNVTIRNNVTDVLTDVESTVDGTVRYFDLNKGRSLKEEVNKKTGVNEKIVVRKILESYSPRLVVFNEEDESIANYYLTNNTVILVENGQTVKKGDILARLVLEHRIGSSAFKYCTSLTSVTIGDGITSIGDEAFRGCTNLARVTIPNSVFWINDRAFENCQSLSSITIHTSDKIGTDEFRKRIYIGAFENCTSLTSVTIGDGVNFFMRVGDSLFLGDLVAKYHEGRSGTYTTTAPLNKNSKWTKQSVIGNKSTSEKKSSGSVSAFPGRWRLVEGRSDAKDVELFKDGSGTADGSGITWKVENGRFHILHPFYTFSAYYNVTGSTVTFTDENGAVTKYQKK